MPTESVDPGYGIQLEVASRLFLELAALVRSDPVLDNEVETWVIPGRSEDEVLRQFGDNPDAVKPEHCPLVELWPEPRDGQPRDNLNQQATLSVRVRIFLRGNNPLDSLNFWGRIQKAVYPDLSGAADRAVRLRLAEAGSDGAPVLIGQPVTATKESGNSLMIAAEGSFSATYKIRGA